MFLQRAKVDKEFAEKAQCENFSEKLYTAVNSGALNPGSLLGQMIACTVDNLSKASSAAFRYADVIHDFLAVLRQRYGRGIVDFLRGLVGTQQRTLVVLDAAPNCNLAVFPSNWSIDRFLFKNRLVERFIGYSKELTEEFAKECRRRAPAGRWIPLLLKLDDTDVTPEVLEEIKGMTVELLGDADRSPIGVVDKASIRSNKTKTLVTQSVAKVHEALNSMKPPASSVSVWTALGDVVECVKRQWMIELTPAPSAATGGAAEEDERHPGTTDGDQTAARGRTPEAGAGSEAMELSLTRFKKLLSNIEQIALDAYRSATQGLGQGRPRDDILASTELLENAIRGLNALLRELPELSRNIRVPANSMAAVMLESLDWKHAAVVGYACHLKGWKGAQSKQFLDHALKVLQEWLAPHRMYVCGFTFDGEHRHLFDVRHGEPVTLRQLVDSKEDEAALKRDANASREGPQKFIYQRCVDILRLGLPIRQQKLEGLIPEAERDLDLTTEQDKLLAGGQQPTISIRRVGQSTLEPTFQGTGYAADRLVHMTLGGGAPLPSRVRNAPGGPTPQTYAQPSSPTSSSTQPSSPMSSADARVLPFLRGPSHERVNKIRSPIGGTTFEAWICCCELTDELIEHALANAREKLCRDDVQLIHALTLLWMDAVVSDGDTSLSPKQCLDLLWEQLLQYRFERARADAGERFGQYLYSPTVHPETDRVFYLVPDFQHAVKNLVQQLSRRRAGTAAGSSESGKLLDDQVLLRIIKCMMEDLTDVGQVGILSSLSILKDLSATVGGEGNKLSVHRGYSLPCCAALQSALRDEGLEAPAALLQALGAAVMGVELRGLSQKHRSALLHNLLLAGHRVLGNLPLLARKMPAQLQGIPVIQILTLMRFVEAREHMLTTEDSSIASMLNERALLQMSIEAFFGMLTGNWGYKGNAAVISRAMPRFLSGSQKIIAKPSDVRGFTMKKKEDSSYFLIEPEEREEAWNVPCRQVDELGPNADLGGVVGDDLRFRQTLKTGAAEYLDRIFKGAHRANSRFVPPVGDRHRYRMASPQYLERRFGAEEEGGEDAAAADHDDDNIDDDDDAVADAADAGDIFEEYDVYE